MSVRNSFAAGRPKSAGRRPVLPSGREAPFGPDDLIVSKTDPKGRLTYCNDVFLRVSGFSEAELLGQPHSIIRHPDMPRCVFKLMWDTIQNGGEIFAYVVNLAKNGDHYWVLAHVTPSFGPDGAIVGYHSNRRKPKREAVEKAAALYRDLRQTEEATPNRKDGLVQAGHKLASMLEQRDMSYDRFVLSL